MTPSRPIASNESSHSSASSRSSVSGESVEVGADLLERRPALRERRLPVLDSVPDEEVERDEAGRDLGRELAHAALRGMQPGLHRVEVEDAVPDDHDLAVDRRARGEEVAERRELGEVAEERPRVPRPEPELAGGVLEQPAEAVPLRLVLPLVAGGQLADELRLHRRERDRAVEARGALDRLAAPARAAHVRNRNDLADTPSHDAAPCIR